MRAIVSQTSAQALLADPASQDRDIEALEQQVPRRCSCKTVFNIFLSGACIYDVIGDVTVTKVFIHSPKNLVKKIGAACLLCLVLTVPFNFVALQWHRSKFKRLYDGMQQKNPVLDNCFRLLALSQPEIMIVALEFGSHNLLKSLTYEATQAIRDLKARGFWAQCREDVPQFGLQWFGVIVQLMDGDEINTLVWLSLGGTSVMLFVKTIMNLIVCMINAKACDQLMVCTAEQARWSIDRCLGMSEWSHFAIQGLLTIADFAFAVGLKAEKEPLVGPLSYQVVALSIFGATYLLGVAMTLRFIKNHRDWLWPLLLALEKSTAIVALSGVHFQIVAGVIPFENRGLLYSDKGLLVAPMLRVLTLGLLVGWCIWKTEFAVQERLLVPLAIYHFVAFFHMLMLVNGEQDKAHLQDSFRIEMLERRDEVVLQKQIEIEKELQDQAPTDAQQQHQDEAIRLRDELYETLVPIEPFEGLDFAAALRIGDAELRKKLPNQDDRTAYLKWKQGKLEGEDVTEDLVGVDLMVKRGTKWHYDPDSDDEETPEDGGHDGRGVVLGFKTSLGRRSGKSDDIPEHDGWVKVRWQATGYSQTYRLCNYNGKGTELKFAREGKASSKAEAGKDLKPHHLRPSFGYKLGITYPHYALFDNDPDACWQVGGFRPGDRVKTGATTATCIGLKSRGKKSVALYFHCDDDDGAGTFRTPEELRTLERVGWIRVEETKRADVDPGSDLDIPHDVQHAVTETLDPSFDYMTRAGWPIPVDASPEKLKKFRLPFEIGDICVDRLDSEQMQCIGVACDPARRYGRMDGAKRFKGSQAEVWFHVLGHEGAGVRRSLYKNFHRYTKRKGDVTPYPRSQDRYTPERTKMLLKEYLHGGFSPDQSFPRGQITSAMFDMNDEMLKKVTGFQAGERLTLQGGRSGNCLTLVGLAISSTSDVDELEVFWHYEDNKHMDNGAKPKADWEHCQSRMRVLQDGEASGRQHLTALAKRIKERRHKAGGQKGSAEGTEDLLKLVAMLEPQWQLPKKDNDVRQARRPARTAADGERAADPVPSMPEDIRSAILADVR